MPLSLSLNSYAALTATTAQTIQGNKPTASYSNVTTTSNYYFGLSPDGGTTSLFNATLVGLSTKTPNDYSVVETTGGIPNAHYTFTDVDGDNDAGITINSPTLEWKKWNSVTSTWNSMSAGDMASTFAVLDAAGVEKLKAIVTADSYPASQYGDPFQGDLITPALNKEFIVYTSDEISGLRTKYHTEANGSTVVDYPINVGFPKTGFNGAEFKIVLKSDSPSMYTWELGSSGSGITSNSVASVDSAGSVTLKSLGSVTIVATNISGSGSPFTYTINPTKWFDASYSTNTDYRTSTEYCLSLTGANYGLPARADITNANLSSIPPYKGLNGGGASVTFPVNATYTRSASHGTLLSDWGNVSLYNSQFAGDFWALEPFTTSRAYTMTMPNSGNANFYITTSNEDVNLPINRVSSLIYDANFKPLCLSRATPNADSFKQFDVNGETFPVNTGMMGTGFPSTAFYGAKFKVTLTNGSPNDYYWFNHRPLNWTIDETSGTVQFNVRYTDAAKVITPASALNWGSTVIYAVGKENTPYAGQYLKAYIDYPRKYIFPFGTGTNLYWAGMSCQSLGSGWRLPTRAELTNSALTIPNDSGFAIPSNSATRQQGSLIGEWGHVNHGNYPDSNWAAGDFIWTGERWKNVGNGWNFYVHQQLGTVDSFVHSTYPGTNINPACVYDSGSLSVVSDSLTGIQINGYTFSPTAGVPSTGSNAITAASSVFLRLNSNAYSDYNWYSSDSSVFSFTSSGVGRVSAVGNAVAYGIGKSGTTKAGTVITSPISISRFYSVVAGGISSQSDLLSVCGTKRIPSRGEWSLGSIAPTYSSPVRGYGTYVSEYGTTPGASTYYTSEQHSSGLPYLMSSSGHYDTRGAWAGWTIACID